MHQTWWLLIAFLLTGWYLRDRLLRRRPLPPGPLGFPVVGSLPLVGMAPHLSLHALSKTYGPIMYLRIGSTHNIVVSSPEKVELFLRGTDFADRPHFEIFISFTYGRKGFASANYGPTWRYLRKLCVTHLLSTQKVASFGSSRRQELQLFIQTLNEAAKARKPVNVSAALEEVVTNMACRMIMGRKFEAGDEEGDRFHALVNELAELISTFNLADHIPSLRVLDLQGLKRRMRKLRDGFDAVLDKILDEHLERRKNKQKKNDGEEEEDDFVAVMLEFMEKDGGDNQADGIQFDRTTIKAIVLEMLEGATETQRSPIDWAFCELLRHPKTMKKVKQELETVVGRHRQVEESDLPNLRYLLMVFKEALRLHPRLGFIFLSNREECEMDGFRIPKGSTVMINLWALAQESAVWDDPMEFKPERFIHNNIDYLDYRLLSFGAGRRVCPGMQLAQVMSPLILAQMVHCFDWELPDGVTPATLDAKIKKGFVMRMVDPLWAIPTIKSGP